MDTYYEPADGVNRIGGAKGGDKFCLILLFAIFQL